jgi:hypothetical protein
MLLLRPVAGGGRPCRDWKIAQPQLGLSPFALRTPTESVVLNRKAERLLSSSMLGVAHEGC